jgi:NAD(P)-dependent dehydrogenase (short-subunit alcohol dehydrogenase family)
MALVGRRREKLEETATAMRKDMPDVDVLICPCDLTKPNEVERVFAEVVQRFGRCDLLFNNAGVNTPQVSLEDVPLTEWQKLVDTNLTGSFICTKEAFKVMKAQVPQGGRIINNGSVSADRPRPRMAPYTATKHAVTGLTKATALDGRAYDIACGQIDIGNAASDLTSSAGLNTGALQATMDGSVKREAEPLMSTTEVARAVEYMASLPLSANVLFMTVMATKMPLVGRG